MKPNDYSNLTAFDLLKMNKTELNDFKRKLGIDNKTNEIFSELIDSIDMELLKLENIPKDIRSKDEKISDEINVLKDSIEKNEINQIFNAFMFLANQNIKYDVWLDIKSMFRGNKKLLKELEKLLKKEEVKINQQLKKSILNQEKLEDLTRMTHPTSIRLTQNLYYDRKISIENAKKILKNIK